jgi:predicted RNA-binding Zn ribbon-like protein
MSGSTHRHPVELDDTIDFINTLEHGSRGDTEEIPTLDAALSWLVERGVLDAASADVERRSSGGPRRADSSRVAAIHRVRQALRDTADAIVGRRPADPEAIDVLNRTLRAREVLVLEPSIEGVTVGERDGGDPIGEALARLVEPMAVFVAGGRTDRLRICGEDTCRYVFFDTSRAGRRVWCDMATCGNRAKARRHRERQMKAEGAVPPH